MADTSGNEFTIIAADRIDKAIEKLGATAAIDNIGKALEITSTGVVIGSSSTTPENFVGIVKAVSGEAEAEFEKAQVVDAFITGRNPTEVPYYNGHVSVPKGASLTVERNLTTYVLCTDNSIKFGDLIAPDDDGKFSKASSYDDAVGRAYSDADSNNVVRAYIRGI
jgi:hypothetical protein